MTALTPYPAAELAGLDTATLRGELARALTLTAETLSYLATIWAELEHRGEDLSDLRHGLGTYLPAIASGKLAAEAVVAFAGQRGLLKRLEGRPIDEQLRLAQGSPVPVAVSSAGQPITDRELPARALSLRQIAVVFDDSGRVRTPIEQRQVISGHRTPEPRKPRRVQPVEIRAALAVISDDELRAIANERGLALAPKCTQDGCSRAAVAKALCPSHYRALK